MNIMMYIYKTNAQYNCTRSVKDKQNQINRLIGQRER